VIEIGFCLLARPTARAASGVAANSDPLRYRRACHGAGQVGLGRRVPHIRPFAPQHLSAPEEFRRVIGAAGVGLVLLAIVSFWSHSSFSRAWIVLTCALVLVLKLMPRRSSRGLPVGIRHIGAGDTRRLEAEPVHNQNNRCPTR
jgi:hypothetical protein